LQEREEPAGERDVPGFHRSQADVNLKFQFSVVLEHLSVDVVGMNDEIVAPLRRIGSS